MRKLLGCVIVAMAWSVSAAAADSDKIRVIIIDGQNNHDWRSTTPWMKKVLEDNGRFLVAVSSNLKPGDKPGQLADTIPFPPDLSKYDVVLSNYNGAEWPKDFQVALESWLKSGKGLVIVHAANNAFSGWKAYNQMIGLGWRDNNFGERLVVDASGKEKRIEKSKGPGAGHGAMHAFAIIIRDTDHPITKGMPQEWMHAPDELYHGLRGPIGEMHLLATAYSDKSKGGTGDHEPMIWTLTCGKGRVFHTPMGHDLTGMHCVGFVTTLVRGTEWAGTGQVTLPIPENFPKQDRVRVLEEK
jgi:type 1 glutamine amidotransferase